MRDARRTALIKVSSGHKEVPYDPFTPNDARRTRASSQEEVSQLINAAPTPFYRILLMTLYATGARRAEATRLKVSDIDSQRMVVHIQGGKSRKDRDVMLSPVLLEALREYWRRLKPKTSGEPGAALLRLGRIRPCELFPSASTRTSDCSYGFIDKQ